MKLICSGGGSIYYLSHFFEFSSSRSIKQSVSDSDVKRTHESIKIRWVQRNFGSELSFLTHVAVAGPGPPPSKRSSSNNNNKSTPNRDVNTSLQTFTISNEAVDP